MLGQSPLLYTHEMGGWGVGGGEEGRVTVAGVNRESALVG